MCTSIREAFGLTPSELHMLDLYRQNGPGGDFRCIMDSFASHVLTGDAYISCMQTAGEAEPSCLAFHFLRGDHVRSFRGIPLFYHFKHIKTHFENSST